MLKVRHESRPVAIACRTRRWSCKYEVTEHLIERILDVGPAMVSEPLHVTLRKRQ